MTDTIKDLALHHGFGGPILILLGLAVIGLVLLVVLAGCAALGRAFMDGWRKADTEESAA